MTERTQGGFIVQIENGQKSEAIQLGSLSRSKVKAIESACKVTIKTEGDTITIVPSDSTKTQSFETIAYKALTEFLKNKGPQDVTAKQIREYATSLKPKPEVKKPEAKKPAARTTASVASQKFEERHLTTIDHTAFDRLLDAISQKARAATLSYFEEEARIGICVEPLTANNGDIRGLKAFVPVLPNGASGDGRLELVREILKRVCGEMAKGSRGSLTKAKLKEHLEVILNERQRKDAKQQFLIARGREATEFSVEVPVYALNGKSVQDFAQYMVGKNRRSALVAFKENPDINFSVKIIGEKESPCHFVIEFDKREGAIDMNDITLAQFLLAKLRMQHEEGRNINKEFVREFLDTSLKQIKEKYTEENTGDKISTIFASMAAQERLSLSYAKPEKAKDEDAAAETEMPPSDAPAAQKSVNDTLNIASAISAGEGKYQPAVRFELTPWKQDEDGELYLVHIDDQGEEQRIYPTPNQWKYIEALRSGDVRTILLHGESGAGKTFWATRIALEMLQQGIYKVFLYERSTAVVGTRQYNPYRKGGDTSIFSSVLEDEIAKHLGMGNINKGYEVFDTLSKVGMLKRYEQMYRRGDNLEGAFLLGDEMQQKDNEEMFHLTTRPKDSAKVVLVGDYKRQNDLGELSGFARTFNMFSNPDVTKEAVKRLAKMGKQIDPSVVTAIKFGVEDIRRSDYTAFVVMMHDVYDEMFGPAEKPKDNKHVVTQGHPSDRYDNPPKV